MKQTIQVNKDIPTITAEIIVAIIIGIIIIKKPSTINLIICIGVLFIILYNLSWTLLGNLVIELNKLDFKIYKKIWLIPINKKTYETRLIRNFVLKEKISYQNFGDFEDGIGLLFSWFKEKDTIIQFEYNDKKIVFGNDFKQDDLLRLAYELKAKITIGST